MASIRGPALNIATTNLIFLISLSGRYCDPGVTQCLYSSIIQRARGRGNEKIIIIRGVVCLKSLGQGSNTSRCWTEIMWHAWSISFHFPAYDLLILKFFSGSERAKEYSQCHWAPLSRMTRCHLMFDIPFSVNIYSSLISPCKVKSQSRGLSIILLNWLEIQLSKLIWIYWHF